MMRTVRPGATHERRPDDEDDDDDEEDDNDELDAGMADEDDDADADSAPYLANKSAFLLELLLLPPLLPCFDFSRCFPSSSRPSR